MSPDFKVHKHAAAKAKVSRKGSARKRTTATVIKVDPKVLAMAKRLAGGDLSRLRIIDAHTVVVLNK